MPTVTARDRDTGSRLNCYSFTFVLSGADDLTDDVANALYEAGCDDAVPCMRARTLYLAFDREADSLEEAILSAMKQVESTNLGFRVVKVYPPGGEITDAVNEYLRLKAMLFAQNLPRGVTVPESIRHIFESLLREVRDTHK